MKCALCDKTFSGSLNYDQHIKSEKHKKKLHIAELKNKELQQNTDFDSCIEKDIKCSICGFYYKTLEDYQSHVESLEHAQKLIIKLNEQSKTQPPDQIENIGNKQMIIDDSSHKSNVLNTDESHNGTEDMENEDDLIGEKKSKENVSLLNEMDETIRDSQHVETMVKVNKPYFSYCITCKKEFTGPEPYNQHIKSTNHKKKMNIISKNGAVVFSSHKNVFLNTEKPHCLAEKSMKVEENSIDDKNISKENLSMIENDEKIIELIEDSRLATIQAKANEPYFSKCSFCEKTFSGPEPYRQHMQSIGHKKKVKNSTISVSISQNIFLDTNKLHNMDEECMEIEENLVDDKNSSQNVCPFNETNKKTIEGSLLVKTQAKINKPYFSKCSICDKTFTGLEPYQQHMASIGHRKKNSLYGNNDTKKTLNDEDNSVCNVMQEIYSSERIPKGSTQVKMTEEVLHEKESEETVTLSGAQLQDLASTDGMGKTLFSNNQLGMQLSCSTCNKVFSGPIPFDQHLKSELHSKKIKSEYLLQQNKFNVPNNESFNQVSFVDSTSDKKESNLTDNKHKSILQWYCISCKIQCSGPIPFNDHLESEIHKKNLRRINFEAKYVPMETLPQSRFDETDCCENSVSDNNLLHSSDNILELSQNDPSIEHISVEQLNCTIFSIDSKINFDLPIEK